MQDAWQECDSGPGHVGFHTSAGVPIVNTSRFPDLGAMVAHAHSLNLTAGWYANKFVGGAGRCGASRLFLFPGLPACRL